MSNLVVNGDMELTTNWNNAAVAPTENVRSSTQKRSGSYSRKFTIDAQYAGIQSDNFTTITGKKYLYKLFVYPPATKVYVGIRKGDNSGWITGGEIATLTPNTWNRIYNVYTETAGGNGAYIVIIGPAGVTSGSWYVDDVSVWVTHPIYQRMRRIRSINRR